jgi:hypothetical protein
MVSLTPTELLKVLKVANVSKRNHAMILFAFRFGMRASEVRLAAIRHRPEEWHGHNPPLKRLEDISRTDDECARPAAAVRDARPERLA